ncbi:hypothetical protein GF1_16130 [Desulfolithobacter dissulfuricans]|uniref:Peptidase S24/S26A/S26B/S26C domain-containing protein n=2 Tax=Desulfolithobacter dissulfuricans TaxID=2795293 RepID=A0A915XJY0_9BACT|nr:hypothetical protein GF1_16130 [Desulfolithobacter dissulfuricans]
MLALGRFILAGRSDDEIEQRLATLREQLAKADSNLPSGQDFRTSVPLISWTRAGEWAGRTDPSHSDDDEEWVPTLSRVSPDAFALRVEGDLMEPEFREGDIIVVDPAREPVSGSFVVARVDNGPDGNGETTLKQFVKDGGCIYLKPLNYRYPIMDMTGREFRIVGVVVEKRKEYV